MNGPIDPIFYGLVCTATLWLALLSAGARLKIGGRSRSPGMKLAFGIATALLLFLPTAGLPLWKWVFSFCPNPSLPMLGIVCAALWQRLFDIKAFSAADWRAAWIFGATAGTGLYLQPFCFDAPDLYYWGWDEDLAVWVMAGLAVLFLCWGNRLGILFIAALVAYELQALESHNAWDYIIDPFYWLIACGVLAARAAARWLERRRRSDDASGEFSAAAVSANSIDGRSP